MTHLSETLAAMAGQRFANTLFRLLEGLGTSLSIFVLTVLLSLPLGLLVAFGRMSKHAALRLPVKFYISVMRGTPLVLQLMLIYFGPYYIFGINIGSGYRFPAVIIGFALNYAAYFAEIYRAGIESIPVGQYEAGQVLGFSKAQVFLRIVFPQTVKRILPPVTNELITLVKDTSLAMVVAVDEMFTASRNLASAQVSVFPYLLAGILFYCLNYAVAFGMEALEKRLNYYR